MRNAVIWFVAAKYIVGKVKPPEETGLTLSHKIYAMKKKLCK